MEYSKNNIFSVNSPFNSNFETHMTALESCDYIYLKGHLTCKDQFVALEQASRRVLIHGKCDAINQIANTGRHLFGRLSFCNGLLENHTESLASKM